MARIAGVNLPPHKHTVIALTAIFGIGRSSARRICADAGVEPTAKVKDLTEDEVSHLRAEIEKCSVEGDLRREVALNIKRLQEIGSYRGLRHRRNLPVRGQRTKTNARQRRGPKRTVGARRKATK